MDFKKIGTVVFKGFFSLLGISLGLVFIDGIQASGFLFYPNNNYLNLGVKVLSAVVFGLIFFLLSGTVIRFILRIIKTVEGILLERSLSEILIGTGFLIVGLIIAFLINQLINSMKLGYFGGFLSVTVYVLFVYLSVSLGLRSTENIVETVRNINFNKVKPSSPDSTKKILDTSAIIDGRILPVTETGFLEGEFVLPMFVLEELQGIADSSNALTRNKGRRGLEVVNSLKESKYIDLVVTDEDFPEIKEVDSKLLKLATQINGKIVTNDYNLNMVAGVQDIEVLNINELVNAVTPPVIPGDTMEVDIIKAGENKDQGVAYLSDGTMVVVKDGYSSIGSREVVEVTRILQTDTGKMIFAKI